MRKLTASQKKVMNEEMRRNPDIRSWDDLSVEVQDKLEQINITEILCTEVDRYIHDKVWSNL